MDSIEIDSLILFSSIMLNISLKIALKSPVDLKIVRFVFCTYWENSLLSESLSITQFGHSQSWFGRLIPKSIIKNNIFDEVRTGFPMACSCHGFVTVTCSDVSVVNLFSALSAEKSRTRLKQTQFPAPRFYETEGAMIGCFLRPNTRRALCLPIPQNRLHLPDTTPF